MEAWPGWRCLLALIGCASGPIVPGLIELGLIKPNLIVPAPIAPGPSAEALVVVDRLFDGVFILALILVVWVCPVVSGPIVWRHDVRWMCGVGADRDCSEVDGVAFGG